MKLTIEGTTDEVKRLLPGANDEQLKPLAELSGGQYQDYVIKAKFGKSIDLPEKYKMVIYPEE